MAIELNTAEPELDENGQPKNELLEVFSIDGKPYSIPSKPRRGLSLKYLKLARKEGTQAAVGWLLEEALGEEGYDALSDYDDLTNDQLQAVTRVVLTTTLGGLEGPKA
jgi:hypothetical protein